MVKRGMLSLLLIVILINTFNNICPMEKDIVIEGTSLFHERISESFHILEEKAPDYYKYVRSYIRKIRLTEDGFNGLYSSGTYQITCEEFDNCCKYMIATNLVHEAYHMERLKKGRMTCNMAYEECLAVNAQKKVAVIIDAPEKVHTWLDHCLETKYWEKYFPPETGMCKRCFSKLD